MTSEVDEQSKLISRRLQVVVDLCAMFVHQPRDRLDLNDDFVETGARDGQPRKQRKMRKGMNGETVFASSWEPFLKRQVVQPEDCRIKHATR